MLKSFKIIVLIFSVLVISSSISISKGRKIPEEAYIKTIKLEQSNRRHETALILLDSMFLNYGYTPAGINLLSISVSELFEESGSKQDKVAYMEMMYDYSDSLSQICSDKKNERFSPDSCKKYIRLLDSLKMEFRSQLYKDK